MDEFLKMDIFFVVTTVAVIVLTVLVALVLVRLFRILHTVGEISTMLSEEGKELRADIHHMRAEITQKGALLAGLAALGRFVGKRSKKSKEDSR
jgi:hypothetical protein